MVHTENDGVHISPEMAKTWSVIFFIVAVCVLIAGGIAAIRISHRVDAHSRELLLTRVKTAAYLVPPASVEKLNGSYADTERSEYISLKKQMQDLREINTDARFVYLMGSNGSKLFFYVDSENPGSTDYSPPGQIYEETSDLQFDNYENGVSFTEGPYRDSWGTWVSGYAPIKNERNQIIAILGMDVDAKGWQAELWFIRIAIGIIALLLSILFIVAGFYLRRSFAMLGAFQDTNARLRFEQEQLRGTIAKAHVGGWTLIPKTNEVSFDEEMSILTGIPAGTRLSRESFEAMISSEDRIGFKRLLEMSIDHREPEFTHIVTLHSQDGKIRKLRLTTSIHYTSGSEPSLITGTAQDIST